MTGPAPSAPAHENAGSLAHLQAMIDRAAPGEGRLPPVERWNPPFCGDVDIRIDGEGRWFHLGTPIGREALVRLFSTVLRREADGHHYLVTPVEKLRIAVDDVPFLAVEMHAEGTGAGRRLTFRTNLGDLAVAGPDHALRLTVAADGGFVPYVDIRRGLLARATRALAYDLAGLVDKVDGRPGIWSSGVFFPVEEGGGQSGADAGQASGEAADG